MAMPTGLIQLVSEQTMPNLLAALAFKPARLVHLATERTKSRSADIGRAAGLAYAKNVELHTDVLSPMPGLEETREVVRGKIAAVQSASLLPVVNFTGGTKLMSIGAWEAARDSRTASVYVDTGRAVFVDGGTGSPLVSILSDDLGFAPIERRLTVNAIAVANGCERVTQGRADAQRYLPLAEHLLAHPDAEQAGWTAIQGERGLCPNAHQPRTAKGWLDLTARAIGLPDAVARLALEAGLIGERAAAASGYSLALDARLEQTLRRLPPDGGAMSDEYRRAIQPLQFATGFFSGGWWEVIIHDAVRRSGRFRDIRWSAHAGGRGFGEDLEEDVLAVNGVRIAYFSCKRGGHRAQLTTVLEQVDARARRLGGTFAQRFLCVYIQPHSAVLKRAAQLGIRVIEPNDLRAPDCFAPAGSHTRGRAGVPRT